MNLETKITIYKFTPQVFTLPPSIHTLKCISAWMQDGNCIDNPFYVRLKDRLDERENTPAISDEGKQPSPSSFPSVTVSPQTVATEDSGRDVSANNQI